MYSVCQTLLPATTVEHSIECNFYHANESNLVVAGSNRLSVYKIVTNNQSKPMLEQTQTFQFYGNIASMQKIKLGNKHHYKRDSLVLSFDDAKLSIVEYNPETHTLETISMHYFEDGAFRDGYVTNNIHRPIVRVDPENRCVAMLIYGKHIVVIPLNKDEEEDLDHEIYDSSSEDENIDESMDLDQPKSINKATIGVSSGDQIQKHIIGQVAALKPATNQTFKSHVLPSYKIDLSEETCGEKIDNIREIQFLHNYNDPTLVILYESTRTWSGRVAMRQDTFSMVALSMNIHQHLQPIIWTVNNLPYDCLRILPVPKPIGGLLVFASNELIYLNQSVPAFGMALNSFSKESSAFPLNDIVDEEGNTKTYIGISLDNSQAIFYNHNKIFLILRDGDVYIVTLYNDDMRSIKDFQFERVTLTVPPNCLTLCENNNNLLFIGSHVGDSILAELVGNLSSEEPDPYADDDEIYSSMETDEKEPISLLEHDRLLSSSACGRLCYGEAPNIYENLHHDHKDPFIELVTTAGYYKNGSICVFQRTIKPHIEDTYELKSCGDLWTLKPSKQSDESNSRLILNRDYESMVFSTKGELLELKKDECVFETSEPTIWAANMGEDNLSVQIMSSGVRLISNDKIIDSVKFEAKVCDACISDPHIIALTTLGTIYHIQLKTSIEDSVEEGRQYGLDCHDVGRLTNNQIISLTVYKDLSGLFTCDLNTNDCSTYWLLTVDNLGVLEIFSVPDFKTVYSVDNFPSAPIVLADNLKLFVTELDSTIAKTKEILMCSLGRQNHRPLLFSRSETELVVYEAYRYDQIDISNHLKIRFRKIHCELIRTIFSLNNAIEPAYPYQNQLKDEQHQVPAIMSNGRGSRNRGRHNHNLPNLEERWMQNKHWLRHFTDIGGYNGVFLAGFRPYWFIMTDKGTFRVHPMNVEGSIFSFSKYDSDNFIYFTENRELRIARLPKQYDLDFYWPVKKITLQETVWFINYHIDRKIYCVVTSSPNQCTKIMKVGSEPDTMKVEDLEREPGYIPPVTEKFSLRLYDPENWEQIPDCEIEFEEWEQVTCVKNVSLASEGTTSGLKGYIAISTNSCYGEDVPNRGKIWILDLIEVVPEPDKPLTKNKIKKVYCQEQKGPVTTLSHTCGLLMSAVGQKIYLWQLKEEQLDGVAFIDTQIYIHYASSVKNLILVGDMKKSVSLLRYQQETRTLSLVSRDPKELEVFACDFAIDNEILNFVCTDKEMNVIIYSHNPENEDSCGGTKLIRRADFHLGAEITSSCRMRGKVPSIFKNNSLTVKEKVNHHHHHLKENYEYNSHHINDYNNYNHYAHNQGNQIIQYSNEALYCQRKQMTMFSTVDGAIGYLFPVDESVYHYAQMLQNEMTMALPHLAGLNPKAWRLIKQFRPSSTNPCRRILDGELMERFLMLSIKERNDMVKKIGTTMDRILTSIQVIQESTLYF